jgi:hypothetical protein
MSTAEMQACLARLYKHEAYRKLFFLDAGPALEEYRLTEEEAQALRRIDRRQLEVFAAAVRMKRMRKYRAAFPLLFTLYPNEARRYFNRYCELYPAHSEDSLTREVQAFGSFVGKSLATDESVPPYAPDVAQYEMLYYLAKFLPAERFTAPPPDGPTLVALESCPYIRPNVYLGDFRHDIPSAAETLSRNRVRLTLEDRGEFFYIFKHVAPGREPKLFRVNAPTREVLWQCDGATTILTVANSLERQSGQRDLGQSLLELVRGFVDKGVLGV